MRRITVTNSVTLDGVMQAPAGRNEDTRGGFPHGGWALPYDDAVKGREMGKGMAKRADLLFGRRTYEHLFQSWHGRTDNPFTAVLDGATKYVTSNTLTEPLPWVNSHLLGGDPADAVAQLKADGGNDLVILGSGRLIRALVPRGLIDEFVLLIHPLVLGTGQRLFGDDGALAKFTLTDSVPTTTGVIIATYALQP